MTLGQGDDGPPRSLSARLHWRRGNRKHYSLQQKVLGGLAVTVALVLVGGSLTAYLTFRAYWDSVKRIDVRGDLGAYRPPPDPNALNVLLIGSDTRAGANKKFGRYVTGQRSDTIMILHIAPGAHQVEVLSFPRDSVVPILACSPEPGAAGQTAQPTGYVEQINATFASGGPGCLWKTIEHTTGIHIDDFIELTFTGFEHVIDDIGGVNICLPVAIHDPKSGLNLTAGPHHVRGREALAFWRVRYIGEGSDLQRIRRDQFLMASLLQGIEHSGLIHSPGKIFSVIQDVARHGYITTDSQLSPGRLLTIADGLRRISTKSVQFIEVPTVTYPGNVNWVQWQQPQATSLFTAIAHDTKLPKAGKHKTATNGTPALDVVSPSLINVTVLNGSTVPGAATRTAAALTARGFNVVGHPSDAASLSYTKSVIEYASAADLPAARTLAALVNNVSLTENSSLAPGTIDLILGSSFTALRPSSSTGSNPSPSPTASPSSTQNLAGRYGGITGNVRICSDASVFAGPDGSS